MCTNPTERVIHLAVLVGAQVEDIHRLRSPSSMTRQHRVDAVLNVEIRFALLPLPSTSIWCGIVREFAVEVEHMAVV